MQQPKKPVKKSTASSTTITKQLYDKNGKPVGAAKTVNAKPSSIKEAFKKGGTVKKKKK